MCLAYLRTYIAQDFQMQLEKMYPHLENMIRTKRSNYIEGQWLTVKIGPEYWRWSIIAEVCSMCELRR